MPVQLNSIEGVMIEIPNNSIQSARPLGKTTYIMNATVNEFLSQQGQVKIGLNREKTAIQLCECQTTEHALWKWEYQDENIKEMYRKRADKFIAKEHEILERSEEGFIMHLHSADRTICSSLVIFYK